MSLPAVTAPKRTRPATRTLSISLVVVTYSREAALLEHLRSLTPYAAWFDEVLIVDNGNSADFDKRAREAFGHPITVLPQTTNAGAVARSFGILASRGDIVVTLDDDVFLLDPVQLEKLEHFFLAHDRVGCVNFKIMYGDGITLDVSDWCHPRDHAFFADSLFETTYISEGACAFNGPLVRSLGAYPLDLFIGQEGVELAARIIGSGHGIYYLPAVSVAHTVAAEGRASGRQFYFNARNIFWIALRSYPAILAAQTVFREWSTLFVFSVVRGRLFFFLRGCWAGLTRTSDLLQNRRPLRPVYASLIRGLNRLKPSIWHRLARLWRSKTLD
jgi:GT2 family glycosyltransferase